MGQADAWLEAAGFPAVSTHLLVGLDRRSSAEAAALQTALADTRIAQPAVALSSLLWAKMLGRLGVVPSVVAGHSLGELTALAAAGALTEEQLITATGKRGALMATSQVGQQWQILAGLRFCGLLAAVGGQCSPPTWGL